MQRYRTHSCQVPAQTTKAFRVAFRPVYWAWLSVFLLLIQAQLGKAQSDPIIQQNETGVDAPKGYWRLNTQAASRSTLVQFFGADHHLLYEEILPGKWIKLSRKNQKQFDQLLNQLLANQLVGSRIKTEILPPTPVEPVSPRVSVRSNTAEQDESIAAPYLIHTYVNANGKLYLIVDNPDRLRYKISVVDQRNRTLYEEFTNHDRYRRRLDLSPLPVDSYQVVVQIGNKPFVYTVNRQDSRVAYSLKSPSPQQKQPAGEQNREPTKGLPAPALIDL